MNRLAKAISAAMLLSLAAPIAQAMPSDTAITASAPIILAAGGCGLGFHRGPYGGCRPNAYHGPYWRGPGWRYYNGCWRGPGGRVHCG